MRIATWNISSGIDMSNYSGELFDKSPEVNADDKSLRAIADAIIANKTDVVALQEVTTTNSFKFLENLSALTGLKYFAKFENSPGFLIKNTSIGTAILSKFPIQIVEKKLFENPNLTKMTKNGMYKTHDKGFLEVSIVAENKINVITTQFLPFHRFDANILAYKAFFDEFQRKVINNHAIVCGDFNVVSGKTDLQKLLDMVAKEYNFVFDDVTTIDNKKCDNILVPKNINIQSKKIVTNTPVSDHFLCYVDI